jgi:hypothetical protein
MTSHCLKRIPKNKRFKKHTKKLEIRENPVKHPILRRAGMHLRSRKMVQDNGFPNRLLDLVRIFTVRLVMSR